ncbi:hypothetical protein [Streptomyces sp. KN37]|uniref:hypothetical protein n=1 Tax=Streptomyces sp. KN37 TaxID=3090667 RepID=UPI002A74F6D6|nr:hypothetical protein [Streptomyces sp. KN37]WPO70379.1 hypothetical protein R9806_06960 [Streptomyces sp. KN37]
MAALDQVWDRVAVMKRNQPDLCLMASAAARIGAVPALICDNHTPDTTAVLLERLERPYLVTDQGALESMGITSGTVARLTERTACVDGTPMAGRTCSTSRPCGAHPCRHGGCGRTTSRW